MTRLQEALDKKASAPAQAPEVVPAVAPDVVDAGLRAWEFDAQEIASVATVPPAPEAPVESDDQSWSRYKFGSSTEGKLVVGPDAPHDLVEQYRRLGATLHHRQLQRGARTAMVASAVTGEGKTLTAINLALTLSHSFGRSVLLLDADLRRPTVHEVLQLPNATGLSDVLEHPDGGPLPIRTITPRLAVLTAGPANHDPMSALVSDMMRTILAEAVKQFDWVIVDTPPVALLPDAKLLAAMIDTALLVVGANTTPFPLAVRAIEAIGEDRILGVVLNRMAREEMVAGADYSYYGYARSASKDLRTGWWRVPLFGKRKPEVSAG